MDLFPAECHKLTELRQMARGLSVEIIFGGALPISPVEEDGATLTGNALKKATAYVLATGEWALADESGLEVVASAVNPAFSRLATLGRVRATRRTGNCSCPA
ncbi:MAG: non-canonical purine NTP pyrophosphatase [Bacillota bacterium]